MDQQTRMRAVEAARRRLERGDPGASARLCRQLLHTDARCVDALNLLALCEHQIGHADRAAELLLQAIAIDPQAVDVSSNLGMVLKDLGRAELAAEHCRQALSVRPEFPEALNNLGAALKDLGQWDQAICSLKKAVALRPDFAQAWSNLGGTLKDKGCHEEAVQACMRAIQIQPHAQGFCNLSAALIELKAWDGAIAACGQAIALQPRFPLAFRNLGIALKQKGSVQGAMESWRIAIQLQPDYCDALFNLGTLLKERGELAEAIQLFGRATAADPRRVDALLCLGLALTDNGEDDEAVGVFRRAIERFPDCPDSRYDLAMLLIQRGEFEEGWEKYEWRIKVPSFTWKMPSFAQPRWDGSPLKDQTLLIHCEQGFGDSIQFLRYVPLAAARCGSVVVQCPAALEPLARSIRASVQWVAHDQALPDFDLHTPLMSLPHLLKTTLQNVPAQVPYLRAYPRKVEDWRRRLAGRSGSDSSEPSDTDGLPLRVGVVWAGNPEQGNDRNRSMSLCCLSPLAQIEGVELYSLQKGRPAEEARELEGVVPLIDWSHELETFADTAALVSALDLVVSVDTAVGHLAGALGKDVWLMLSYVSDWRWMRRRCDCPWYPTMRLFRQERLGDWDSVINRVALELRDKRLTVGNPLKGRSR